MNKQDSLLIIAAVFLMVTSLGCAGEFVSLGGDGGGSGGADAADEIDANLDQTAAEMFETQVSGIFGACVACHKQTPGGLNASPYFVIQAGSDYEFAAVADMYAALKADYPEGATPDAAAGQYDYVLGASCEISSLCGCALDHNSTDCGVDAPTLAADDHAILKAWIEKEYEEYSAGAGGADAGP